MRLLLSFTLLFIVSQSAKASYRVYQLKVQHYDAKGKPKKVEKVLSTLDSSQYENYHGGYRSTKVELLDTWFCPGDTSRKKYCPKPKERTVAGEENKRTPVAPVSNSLPR